MDSDPKARPCLLDERFLAPAGGVGIALSVFLGALLACSALIAWSAATDLQHTRSREDRAILVSFAPVTLLLVTFLASLAARAFHRGVRVRCDGRELIVDLAGLPVLGRSTIRIPLARIVRLDLSLERRDSPGLALLCLRLARQGASGLREDVVYLVPEPGTRAETSLRKLAHALSTLLGWPAGIAIRDDSNLLEFRLTPSGAGGPSLIPGRFVPETWKPGQLVVLRYPVSSLQEVGGIAREFGRMCGATGGTFLGYLGAGALGGSLVSEILVVGGGTLAGAWPVGRLLESLADSQREVELDWSSGRLCVRTERTRQELALSDVQEVVVSSHTADDLLEATHDPTRAGETRGDAIHRNLAHPGRLRWYEILLDTSTAPVSLLRTATFLRGESEPERLRQCAAELARGLKVPIRG